MLRTTFFLVLLLVCHVMSQTAQTDVQDDGEDDGSGGFFKRLARLSLRNKDDTNDSTDESTEDADNFEVPPGDVLSNRDAIAKILREYNASGSAGDELPPDMVSPSLQPDDSSRGGLLRRGGSRHLVRGAFRGIGNGYKGYRDWQKGAMAAVNDVVVDTMEGLSHAITLIPYDDLQSTAANVGTYFQGLINSGVSLTAFDDLLTTRAGDPESTIAALIKFQDSPDLIAHILQDIGDNYKKVYTMTTVELENFLNVMFGGDIPDQIQDNPFDSLGEAEGEVGEATGGEETAKETTGGEEKEGEMTGGGKGDNTSDNMADKEAPPAVETGSKGGEGETHANSEGTASP